MLSKKKIVVGVTGGIAVYKTCTLVSKLSQLGAEVDVIMTANAKQFVSPLTFESLSNRPVVSDMFKRETPWEIEHVSLAQKADLIVIAPATANIIGKISCGICDDMLSTTVMASRAPLMVAPAMNTGMYDNPFFTDNLNKLIKRGVIVVDSGVGHLACGDNGKGRMAEPEEILKHIQEFFSPKKNDYAGLKVLITAGATSQPLDGVRYITNRSSGKMGIALAQKVTERGGNVTLILGSHKADISFPAQVINVSTTDEMFDAVMDSYTQADIIIKAAAPCDYKPIDFSTHKLTGERLVLELVKNKDIAAELGKVKGRRFLTVFSAETDNIIDNAKRKMNSKNADLVVANDVTLPGAGFDGDTNIVSIINKQGNIVTTEKLQKTQIADIILDEITKNRIISQT